jgi:hypothetical protein
LEACADYADLVIDRACYRELEVADTRVWDLGKIGAIRLSGNPYAEIVIEADDEVVVLATNGERLDVAAELRFMDPDGGFSVWPPIPLDLDQDSRDEAVFGVYGGHDVHVLDFDPSSGAYALTISDTLLPEDARYLHIGVQTGTDAPNTLLASTFDDTPADGELYLVALQPVDGAYQKVGPEILTPELGAEAFHARRIPPDATSAARVGYLSGVGQAARHAVTILSVTPGVGVEVESVLRPQFDARDFLAGDFDGDDLAEVYVAGYDSGQPVSTLFEQEGLEWVEQPVVETPNVLMQASGDVTGNGVPDLLSHTAPTLAVDLSEEAEFEVFAADWALAVLDLDGALSREVLFAPDRAFEFEPSLLRILVSFE